ncbi:MAG TPA: hypothetical protein PLM65_12920 [Smithella sp.]|nr:hypothetical protein [Smithella sp.]
MDQGFFSAIIVLLLVFAMFYAIYRSVRGKKSTNLKRFGWLELFIAYLCIVVPLSLLMGLGKISPVFEKMPALSYLGTFDFLARLILIFASFYIGVCLWKTLKNAVRKAKIFLIALLTFNVFIVRGFYNIAIYRELARTDVSIPASVVVDAFTRDIIGALVSATVAVAWYVYLSRSQRVKELYDTPSVTNEPAIQPVNSRENIS